MFGASCQSSDDETFIQSAETTAVSTSEPATSEVPETTSPAPSSTETASPASDTTEPSTTDAVQSSCVRLTDFASEAEQSVWFIVNDNVMGGRSEGDITFRTSEMLFAGSINTDGGGFSSVRARLEPGALAGATHLLIRARGDQRPYRFTLSDELAGRDSRISHQGLIELAPTDDWQEVWVPLSDLSASLFGRSVDTPAFDLDTANEIGIIVSDSVDGPFSLDVDWIDVCS